MITVAISEKQKLALLDGKLRAVLIKQRKRMPYCTTQVRFRIGGRGGKLINAAPITIKAVRFVTRINAMYWSYGVYDNHMTLSSLDFKQLAKQCGYDDPAEFDNRYRNQPVNEPLVKLGW